MLKKITPSARYTIAVASIAVAILIRIILSPWVGNTFPFFSFYVAVTVTTWCAGTGPGLVSISLGYLATDLFFFPSGAFRTDPFGVLIYLSVAGTIVLFGKSLHKSSERAEASAAEARQRQMELEREMTHRMRVEAELCDARDHLKNYSIDLEKQVEERTAKLRETIHSLEGFCYSIAHDLRAPIRAMQGYAAVLVEECALSAAGREYARRISQSSVRMDHLVRDLLAYGRLAHEPVERTSLHLEAEVDHVLAHLSEEIKFREAEIKVVRPLPQILGHHLVLEQILGNLLLNAMKFVSQGTRPRICIRADDVSPDTIRLCVCDNGIGIDPKYHERIFNIFERLHRPEEYTGTGIGLALVKKGAERMGGRAGVESTAGKGSCFWVELARALQPA